MLNQSYYVSWDACTNASDSQQHTVGTIALLIAVSDKPFIITTMLELLHERFGYFDETTDRGDPALH